MEGSFIELEKILIDFDQVDAWRDQENDDLPVHGFLSFYEACGLRPAVEELCKQKEDGKITAVDHLYCNFYTIQRIKRVIEHNWKVYSIDVIGDNNVVWDTTKWQKNQKHYEKRLRPRVQNSLNFDFINFCPNLDDDLEDNVIVFRDFIRPEANETSENIDTPLKGEVVSVESSEDVIE